VNVYVPRDRVTNLHQGYGFVEFRNKEDADYVSVDHILWSCYLLNFEVFAKILWLNCEVLLSASFVSSLLLTNDFVPFDNYEGNQRAQLD
jgi:hypothetical protein